MSPVCDSYKTDNTPIESKNLSLEFHGSAMLDESGKVLNESINRIGGGKIEAVELSGILHQIDNSMVYNTG